MSSGQSRMSFRSRYYAARLYAHNIKQSVKVYARTIKNLFTAPFQIGIHFSDHCNLKCKCCNHYSPVAPVGNLTVESVARSLSLLKERVAKRIDVIHLVGGEPLLNPDADKLIRKIRECMPADYPPLCV